MERKIKSKKAKDYIELNSLCSYPIELSIHEFIQNFNSRIEEIKQSHQNQGWEIVRIGIKLYDRWDENELEIISYLKRIETEEEAIKREARNRKRREKKSKENKVKEDKERALFEKLKAKYGG